MHKIFAKPLFLGKKVDFLPQCHSTNDELLLLVKNSVVQEGSVIYTDHQLKGRGQRGNVWFDELGKNVLMSILLRPKFLSPTKQFYLNLITGLAIVDVLGEVLEGKVELKWPNDVYVNDRKIAGILIESNLRGTSLESAVIGIGLNVNQSGFNMHGATSLSLESGKHHDRFKLMELVVAQLEKWYLKLKGSNYEVILESYHDLLMWRGELHAFKGVAGTFKGEIVGINQHGNLAINVDGKLQYFGLKEVEFIN
ncbi:BirA family transcriptional regulator, biotin operon repressor / biotin-[acetyl-CoA-carboxylase] ligase [Ekhidna lutea]|uniref:BirA family transcriptional regulator, biotin operon repressor / biotin-[acetyl-CoA-carboxylase] ligase n=1 Tax=Ekhidna lutea TaxID=447679 RepID=A0A239J9Q2_EKHLU|nr:biotin--[acetyl-CoA-carboxylase] ligase [Ekhidna lutea]SNT02607.1 BirA family transcriptional regulator, biotin operon repressor / biotin-[acetyl-CoA-carboxylase] ligase [Ekhidna lutea]